MRLQVIGCGCTCRGRRVGQGTGVARGRWPSRNPGAPSAASGGIVPWLGSTHPPDSGDDGVSPSRPPPASSRRCAPSSRRKTAPAVDRRGGSDLAAGVFAELTSGCCSAARSSSIIWSGQENIDKDLADAVLAYAKQPAPAFASPCASDSGDKGKGIGGGPEGSSTSRSCASPGSSACPTGSPSCAASCATLGPSPRWASARDHGNIIVAIELYDLRELTRPRARSFVADTDGKIAREDVRGSLPAVPRYNSGTQIADATIAGDAAEALRALRSRPCSSASNAVPIADALSNRRAQPLPHGCGARRDAAQLAGQLGMAPGRSKRPASEPGTGRRRPSRRRCGCVRV